MVTEVYVSFETAKLLKEKGFDYYPDGSYWLIDANNVMYWVSEIGAYDYVDVPTESFQRPKNGYRLVTQAMAMKWLREKHGLFINLYPEFGDVEIAWNPGDFEEDMIGYKITIIDLNYGELKYKTLIKHNYEEACETAIRYCLENLIQIMCLIISEKYHPDYKPLIAEEDIEVVKYLALPGDVSYFYGDGMIGTVHCPLRTPFMSIPIVFGDNEECVLESSTFEAKMDEDDGWCMEVGIHAYTSSQGTCLSGLTPFQAYIPKGTKYYFGTNGDIVAEKMIIKNTKY